MGRWKPPAKAATPYITRAGYRALETEAKSLWDKRHIVVKHLAAAAAEGDRSENAEYIYRKKEMREIDRRIGYLQRRMPKLRVVDEAPADQDRVFFGAAVELENADGGTCVYHIVGGDESRPEQGEISVDSPVAQALMGRGLDDTVEVDVAGRRDRFIIVDIKYSSVLSRNKRS
ncbi:MAG: GreA/GreB family elongation factor [Gammaproteobacteria bacterium]|nr:GreA/GreB family elongation factor [Gammaproteobacteria bacterium]